MKQVAKKVAGMLFGAAVGLFAMIQIVRFTEWLAQFIP